MNKLTKGRRVICLLLTVFLMSSYCRYVEAKSVNNNAIICQEVELVSLRTILNSKDIVIPIPTMASSKEVENANATSEKAIGAPEQKKKKKFISKVVKPKRRHRYLSLEQVKARMNIKMDLSKPSGLSKKSFVKLMKNLAYDYTGVFKRNAELIWNLAHKKGFNEIFFMAIVANESWWGSSEPALKTNNYTSQMINKKLIYYSSEKECFVKTVNNLVNNYLKKEGKYYNGKTLYAVNKKYCVPGVHKDGTPYKYKWADDVYKCMKMIIG